MIARNIRFTAPDGTEVSLGDVPLTLLAARISNHVNQMAYARSQQKEDNNRYECSNKGHQRPVQP